MDRQSASGGGFVVAAICFLVCAFICLRDLGHFLFSKRTQGTVTDVKHVEYFEVRSRKVVGHGARVSYRFVEPDGTRREGADEWNEGAGRIVGQQARETPARSNTRSGDLGSSRIA